MAFSIFHTATNAPRPNWRKIDLGYADDTQAETERLAYDYACDQGGYVCVMDDDGSVVFGTDPVSLDREILLGRNKYFTECQQ